MSHLYIVATPIGNLEDITLRAISILKEVDLILCEDTRTTRVLLKKYEITTPTQSYHAQSTLSKIDQVILMLREGKNIALVSDAGTPAISDPGSLLIQKVKQELGDEVVVSPIPGPSALVSALSASGLTGGSFVFYGFFPHKKGRETLFKKIAQSDINSIFYESPHRIIKTLHSLAEHAPKKKVIIARELTKMFEEIVSGTPAELITYFTTNTEKERGEFVVMVSS